jgi:signal transduction histidine kinase
MAMVAIVALTLVALNVHSLVTTLLDVAISSSEMAGRQVQAFLLRRLPESIDRAPSRPGTLEETRVYWSAAVAKDAELAALLEETMAQSRSIVEIGVADENGIIRASSNPTSIGKAMASREDLRAVRQASPVGQITSILAPAGDYETRVPLGLAKDKAPREAIFTIQILESPVLLREAMMPAVKRTLIASGLALIAAFFFAYGSANLALRPLVHVGHLIDEITNGEDAPARERRAEVARELAWIEEKLNLLGERFRSTREESTQLRSTLEHAMEKLDLRTRRQIENQIALARRLTAINSLTARVAHEIKNPLNSIALRVEMLRSRFGSESADTAQEFSILSEEVQRLDRVVKTFLDFSRPVELKIEPVDAVQVAAEVLAFVRPEAAARGIRTSFEQPDGPVVIEAGRDILKQALMNIAVNAVEAMSGQEREGLLSVRVESNADTCVIVIADTGPGIPMEQWEKIFQLYYTTRPHGTGIGLAMAYRAAQLHGGTIEVSSTVGVGTQFRVLLPMAASIAVTVAAPALSAAQTA